MGETAMDEKSNGVIVQTGSGPRIRGTRISVYDVYYYSLLGRHPTYIAAVLGLSSSQVAAAMEYNKEHQQEVQKVHEQIEARIAAGHSPEVQARLDAVHAHFAPVWEARRKALGIQDHQENDDEGPPGGP